MFSLLLLQIEDLKSQLESCHQQLLDSNKHKQELELQLRSALEREQDIRTGYISPVSYWSPCPQRAAAARVCYSAMMGSPVVDYMRIFSIEQYFLSIL